MTNKGCTNQVKILLEARLHDRLHDEIDIGDFSCTLERDLSILPAETSIELGVNLMEDTHTPSPGFQLEYSQYLCSLVPVEFVGTKQQLVSIGCDYVMFEVFYYFLQTSSSSFENIIDQAEIFNMPNTVFDNNWEALVFEEDLKGELLWTLTNFLKMSRIPMYDRGMNPLILLHGPPGSGKTTLCQGLIQKIAVRLKSTYGITRLIQIKTSSLLSRYYSESAKQVEEIFDSIEATCRNKLEDLNCVLLDEVEGVAGSRSLGVLHGEAQDSLRATNALLRGLDKIRTCPNVIVLCTSNMIDCLDSAFLDRCGLQLLVDSPTFPSQYTILRNSFLRMMSQGIISYERTQYGDPKHVIPSFQEAKLYLVLNRDDLGTKLYRIIQLHNDNGIKDNQNGISGRKLAQLLEQAIMRHLRDKECSLDMAFDFLKRTIAAGKKP
ncbi:P-loop containing nucleoside triphosphate hydrolase protein [Xylogone sp. PMI_703]|nr:P-loop containing nucleoside triphosphate hydrolase protein [Xylogone sp. PMI_703]